MANISLLENFDFFGKPGSAASALCLLGWKFGDFGNLFYAVPSSAASFFNFASLRIRNSR